MPDRPLLAGILTAAARKMRADFDESAYIKHRGAKGTVREQSLLEFLQKYLPASVRATGSSEIIATNGEHSGQIDIVIYDPTAPPLFDRGGHRILPSECVYAVIEVKSTLDKPSLLQSCKNIAYVKRMPKTAYLKQPLMHSREQYGQRYSGYVPTAGFIFAFDSSDLLNMSDEFVAYLRTISMPQWTDAIWVLGRGAYNWLEWPSMNILPCPTPGAHLAVSDAPPGTDVMLNMVMIINTHMAMAYMPPFDFIQYAANETMLTNVSTKSVL